MNLIEALRSGKPFKRKAWTAYAKGLHQLEQNNEVGRPYFVVDGHFTDEYLILEDLYVDDWEVEEKTYTITRAQAFRAAEIILNPNDIQYNAMLYSYYSELGIDPEEMK